MHELTTVQALLRGGPGDGAVRLVECGRDGRPPGLLLFGGGGMMFVGCGDEPVPPEYPVYELDALPEPVEPMSLWLYRFVGTLRG